MKAIIGPVLAATLAACVLPQTTIRTGSEQPSLSVRGAPAGAILYVDGLSVGDARQYDGNPSVLAVLEGVHQIEVRQGASVLLRQKVMLASGETRALTVLPGAQP